MVDVAVLIPTYNRFNVLVQALGALVTNIKGVRIHPVVGNDYPEPLSSNFPHKGLMPDVLDEPTGSLGANLNRLIKYATQGGFEYIMQMDDDHILKDKLDLAPHIEALQDGSGIGWVRLMGCGFHRLTADLYGHYWAVRWDSPEVYITSNRPHLKRADWHMKFGLYPEGLTLGLTEEGFCHQCRDVGKADPDALKVAIPLTYDEFCWDHVGDSWQLKGH